MVCKFKILIHNFENCDGQSTVEFAIVTAGLFLIVSTFSLLWNIGDSGIFVQHALSCASHHIQEVAGGVVGDVFSC